MDNKKQIRKILEYSISELKKDSELLKRGLSDIALLKDDVHSLREYEENLEDGIIDFLGDSGDLAREQAVKVMVVMRGYVLSGLWCKAGGMTFEQSLDHSSGSLAPDDKKSFEDVFRNLIMGALHELERKGFIKKLQKYFVYLVEKNPSSDLSEKMSDVEKVLDVEYKDLGKEMNDSAERILVKS